MTPQLNVFAHEDKPLRIVKDASGKPWLVAKDICDMLNIQNPSKALKALAQTEKITLTNWYGNPRGGIPHSLCLINEPGLQKLLYRSRKPTAKAIHKWVNEVVLPAL